MIAEKSSVKKNSRKPFAIIFVAIVALIGVVSGIFWIYSRFSNGNSEDKDPTNMYSDKLTSYAFYAPDYDLDVTEDAEYMGLDRLLYYKVGAEEFGIDGNAKKYGKGAEFFEEYFEIVINGKWEEYNDLFTDHYYEVNKPRVRFSPQMIYDIHVTDLGKTIDDDGTERYAFNVSYRIYKNTGTFRNDLDSGAAKPLYFEVVEIGGEMKIDRITYYV